jgi:hypothetical protein
MYPLNPEPANTGTHEIPGEISPAKAVTQNGDTNKAAPDQF